MQDPLTNGDAVYSARVMLDIDPEYFNNSSQRLMREKAEQQAQQIKGSIYPNPAKDEATLDYLIADGSTATLEIYSIVGNKVVSFTLESGSEYHKFSIKSLEGGIYVYRVIVNNEIKDTNKFIIIK